MGKNYWLRVVPEKRKYNPFLSPKIWQEVDIYWTFKMLLSFPTVLCLWSFQSMRVVVYVYWFWINKIQNSNTYSVWKSIRERTTSDFLSQSPDFCLNYHTDKPNMYLCVGSISFMICLHWSVLNTPVCHQLRVLEVQVDPEGLVHPSCLGLSPLAFCSPQVRYQPRLAGTGRTRPTEGSGAGGGVGMYGKIKRMGTICKNFQHLPFHPSSQGDWDRVSLALPVVRRKK